MGTCSETICKHRILFLSIQHLAWLLQVHAARDLASIELSFHRCNILRDSRRGVSRGNKNVGCSTWKRRFFALAVRITGKLLKIDGYMLRGVCQALNCLFILATFCVIATGVPPRQTKNEGRGTWKWRCLPRYAMHKRGICRHVVSVRPSVCHVRGWCQNK